MYLFHLYINSLVGRYQKRKENCMTISFLSITAYSYVYYLENWIRLYQIIEINKKCLFATWSTDGSDQLSSLKSFLPKSIYNLERIGRNTSKEVKFVEMTSRCIKWADCRGVYPIFVVPSLHASELESFFHLLMYPVFCATLTENSSSVYETASKLYEVSNTDEDYYCCVFF